MRVGRGGYRETESGLDASFLWSHDRSEKEGGERRGEGKRGWKMENHAKPQEKREREELVLLVVKRLTEYRLLVWK